MKKKRKLIVVFFVVLWRYYGTYIESLCTLFMKIAYYLSGFMLCSGDNWAAYTKNTSISWWVLARCNTESTVHFCTVFLSKMETDAVELTQSCILFPSGLIKKIITEEIFKNADDTVYLEKGTMIDLAIYYWLLNKLYF